MAEDCVSAPDWAYKLTLVSTFILFNTEKAL